MLHITHHKPSSSAMDRCTFSLRHFILVMCITFGFITFSIVTTVTSSSIPPAVFSHVWQSIHESCSLPVTSVKNVPSPAIVHQLWKELNHAIQTVVPVFEGVDRSSFQEIVVAVLTTMLDSAQPELRFLVQGLVQMKGDQGSEKDSLEISISALLRKIFPNWESSLFDGQSCPRIPLACPLYSASGSTSRRHQHRFAKRGGQDTDEYHRVVILNPDLSVSVTNPIAPSSMKYREEISPMHEVQAYISPYKYRPGYRGRALFDDVEAADNFEDHGALELAIARAVSIVTVDSGCLMFVASVFIMWLWVVFNRQLFGGIVQ